VPDYVVHGLRLVSDLPLSGAPAAGPVLAEAPIGIREGRLSAELPGATFVGPAIQTAAGECQIDAPGLARIRVRSGQQIVVQRDGDATAEDAAVLVMGPALAAACHQRGLLPLHASAVEVGSGCVAFVGRPAVGKSAVAATLCGRGRTLVSDDLCVIHSVDGGPVVAPGPAELHLWQDTLDALGTRASALRRVRPGIEKYVLPTRAVEQPLRIRHVVVIDAYGVASLDRRVGLDALSVLVASSWHSTFLEPLGVAASHFALCAQVAGRAAIWRWARPVGVARMHGALSGLEAAWRAAAREEQ
jgi:hypothetical protein